MTEIERKALALVNKIAGHDFLHPRDMDDKCWLLKALCRAIDQHEAFKREVSDAVELFHKRNPFYSDILAHFIIPKPDPLVELSGTIGVHRITLEQALAKHGLKLERIEHE